MTVHATQRLFLDHVIHADRSIAPQFAAGAAGIAIYRHAYRAQLLGCLKSSYDKSWTWMGDSRFDFAAALYIDQNLPHSWSLDRYGATFPDALAKIFPDDIEIAELAMLEHALQDAFVASDGPHADLQALLAYYQQEQSLDALRLTFVPGCTILSATTNAGDIWQAMHDEEECSALVHYPEQRKLVIWRSGHTARFRELGLAEGDAITAMMSGADFETICKALAETVDAASAAELAGGWLARWIGDDMVAGLD